jgi:hypothetical protein
METVTAAPKAEAASVESDYELARREKNCFSPIFTAHARSWDAVH